MSTKHLFKKLQFQLKTNKNNKFLEQSSRFPSNKFADLKKKQDQKQDGFNQETPLPIFQPFQHQQHSLSYFQEFIHEILEEMVVQNLIHGNWKLLGGRKVKFKQWIQDNPMNQKILTLSFRGPLGVIILNFPKEISINEKQKLKLIQTFKNIISQWGNMKFETEKSYPQFNDYVQGTPHYWSLDYMIEYKISGQIEKIPLNFSMIFSQQGIKDYHKYAGDRKFKKKLAS